MATESTWTKAEIISTLTRSPHGKLTDYLPQAAPAAAQDADFFAHLIAWNRRKGQIRDAKVALPVIALAAKPKHPAHVENALAHLAALGPREFARAVSFARDIKAPSRLMRRLVARYLANIERQPLHWQRVAVQHRHTLKGLYATHHLTMTPSTRAILFERADSGVFGVIKALKTMTATHAAAAIMDHKIPFLVARGAMGKRMQEPDVLLALLQRMTPTEIVTNAKTLQKLGVSSVPALRAAMEAALAKVGASGGRGATLKTATAADALEDDDPVLTAKLNAAQERQLDRMQTIDGHWLVLADKSGSMETAIEAGMQVAALLTRLVKGAVHLVFFDTTPRYVHATGKTLEELKALTAGMAAQGGTSIGCGLRALIDRKIHVDGIAIVSDGAENGSPSFGQEYAAYKKLAGNEPTVYWYKLAGSAHMLKDPSYQWHFNQERENFLMATNRAGADLQIIDLEGGVGAYSLPNVVQTMRVGRYSLVDEMFNTPLLSLDAVLSQTPGMQVLAHAEQPQAVEC